MLGIMEPSKLYWESHLSNYTNMKIRSDTDVQIAIKQSIRREKSQKSQGKEGTMVKCDNILKRAIAEKGIPLTDECQNYTQIVKVVAPESCEQILGELKNETMDLLQAEVKTKYDNKAKGMKIQGQFGALLEKENNDLDWKSAMYQMPKGVLSFAIRASTNSLPSLDNLRRWRKVRSSDCKHCRSPCTLKHTLNICRTFLEQRRFDYRHDSVLNNIVKILKGNKKNDNIDIYADLDKHRIGGRTIPPAIMPTALKPDLIIIDKENKVVWIHELSVSFEDNFKTSHDYKLEKYEELKCDIIENGWKCHLEPFSVGSRGMIPFFSKQILRSILKNISSKFPLKKLTKIISKTAVLGSYIIWLARMDPNWHPPGLVSYQ